MLSETWTSINQMPEEVKAGDEMLPLRRMYPSGTPLPPPPDWSETFESDGPLEVDLGCGRGYYVLARAETAKSSNIIGMDTKIKWIEVIQKRARRTALDNLRAIRCDARYDLPLFFSPGSVSGFTIHHPDPWWKKRHRKRRLVQTEFVEQLSRLLKRDGWVYVQTDVPDLALEMELTLKACPSFETVDADELKREEMGDVESHRESKCRQLGIPVQRLAFRLTKKGPAEP